VTQLYLRAFGSMEIVFKHVRYFIKGHLVWREDGSVR
jgi:hypothetical protein